MFTSILVPLDGSVRSERALPYAASLAKAFGGELILLHDETVGLRGDDAPAAADAISSISAPSLPVRPDRSHDRPARQGW